MSAEFDRIYNYPQSIKVLFSHVNEEPVMALCREAWGKRNAYIIALGQAYLYAEDHYLVVHSMLAAKTLGLDETRDNTFQIADIIQQHIGELVNMPPEKTPDAKAIVERAIERQGLNIKLNGENVLERF